MGYLTQTDLAKFEIRKSRGAEDRDLLKKEIERDRRSDKKKNMDDGVKYYKVKNTKIFEEVNFDRTTIDGTEYVDTDHPNIKIPHGFMRILVKQKRAYLVGKPLSLNFKGEEDDESKEIIQDRKEELSNYLGDYFHDFTNRLVTNVSNKGVEYIHVYLDEEGKFKYMLADARNIIPIYDEKSGEILIGVINYWEEKFTNVTTGETSTRIKAEIWGENTVSYYVTDKSGEFIPDPDHEINPKGHFQVTDTLTQETTQEGWGKVPFIEVKNDDDMMTDLEAIKDMIDAYDYTMSDEANDLSQIQQLIWILKGYRGTSLKEFMQNLKKYKSMKVDKDGSAETRGSEIPHETRNVHLKRLEDNIYIFGMGVNLNPEKLGNNPTGIFISFMYNLLDQKAEILMRKMKPALQDFMWFLWKYMEDEPERIEFDPEEISFSFNKTLMTNDSEIIKNLNESNISEETYWEKHPYVDDPAEELKRMEEQRNAQPGFGIFDENDPEEDPEEDK